MCDLKALEGLLKLSIDLQHSMAPMLLLYKTT